ncbi:PadR family transcriptional regulator [Nonomuraea roseoviolacea subsp. roseoviolacea]|uniref:PadR family transcriptional regulator n=1 Tax=Nonomuraea roseoviolacea TaxID=103837 RepID=UPI0031DABF4C
MALRHAVLAALLDGEYSGYQLAKVFDVGVANFWYAAPQQLYAELARLEADGLVSGREVVQSGRPNKRVFTVAEAGIAELAAFAAAPGKPLLIRDDLAVKIHAVDRLDPAPVIAQLLERAEEAAAKLELFERMLRNLRGDLAEEEFLRRGERVGPYLSCLGGCRLEREMRDWCLATAQVLTERATAPSAAGRPATPRPSAEDRTAAPTPSGADRPVTSSE